MNKHDLADSFHSHISVSPMITESFHNIITVIQDIITLWFAKWVPQPSWGALKTVQAYHKIYFQSFNECFSPFSFSPKQRESSHRLHFYVSFQMSVLFYHSYDCSQLLVVMVTQHLAFSRSEVATVKAVMERCVTTQCRQP